MTQLQVTGRKRWHVCSPQYTSNMYGAGKVDTFNPDYKQFPRFKDARCFLDVVCGSRLALLPLSVLSAAWPFCVCVVCTGHRSYLP
jgi:hypothetical protein